MESYIVRIYRRDPKDSRKIAGQVEIIEEEVKRTFGSREELWGILNPEKKMKGGKESG
ncbi:MAG: hypothetical protein PHF56_02650 [Desulfuromonadaceae bacterium]|nr:hypothetical protein [Desulfuromonadaceae bacterium]